MDQPLIIRIQWSWGESKIIETRMLNIISDTLKYYNFQAIEGHNLIIISRGKILDPNFTFGYYGIKSGMRIILTLKKIKTKNRSKSFLEMINMQRASPIPGTQIYHQSHRPKYMLKEAARISDLSYIHWELAPDNSITMAEALKLQENQKKNKSPIYNIPIIETPKSDKIQDAPFPIFFMPEELNSCETMKNGIRYNRGCIPDSL